MSRRRRRQLLVPEARAALDQLRNIVITEQTSNTSVQPQTYASTPAKRNMQNAQAARDNSPVPTPQTGVQGVANQLGIPYQQQDNGELTTRQAGKIGGAIGGSMIQRLISIAEQELAKEQATNPGRR